MPRESDHQSIIIAARHGASLSDNIVRWCISLQALYSSTTLHLRPRIELWSEENVVPATVVGLLQIVSLNGGNWESRLARLFLVLFSPVVQKSHKSLAVLTGSWGFLNKISQIRRIYHIYIYILLQQTRIFPELESACSETPLEVTFIKGAHSTVSFLENPPGCLHSRKRRTQKCNRLWLFPTSPWYLPFFSWKQSRKNNIHCRSGGGAMSRVRVVGIWRWQVGVSDFGQLGCGCICSVFFVGTLMNTFVIICCTAFDVFWPSFIDVILVLVHCFGR